MSLQDWESVLVIFLFRIRQNNLFLIEQYNSYFGVVLCRKPPYSTFRSLVETRRWSCTQQAWLGTQVFRQEGHSASSRQRGRDSFPGSPEKPVEGSGGPAWSEENFVRLLVCLCWGDGTSPLSSSLCTP